MANKINIILVLFVSSLYSCHYADIKGMAITYKNVDERVEKSLDWNVKNLPIEIFVNANTYAINTMGDSHVGKTENIRSFLNKSEETNAVATILIGDITNGNDFNYDSLVQIIDTHNEFPIFPVVGNHDLYFNGWKYFFEYFNTSTYYFTVNTTNAKDLFICLDTGGGTLGSIQLDWLTKLLETERKKYRYCIIATHNNIFRIRQTFSTNPNVEEIRKLLDIFTIHDISMVITGHDHKRNSLIFGNTSHITMDALKGKSKNTSYLSLIVNEEEINFTFKPLQFVTALSLLK